MIKRGSVSSILKTSLPAALDLSSQPVMWLIEAVFIGRLSAAALGGVGFALQVILLTITLLLTFVMGAIILINRYLGSQDRRKANHILGQTMMMGFLLSIPIALIWYFGGPFLFRIISEREILNNLSAPYISGMNAAVQYLHIVSLFAPIVLTNFVGVSMIRGAGETHISMLINVTMNAVNVFLAPVLIYGLFGLPRLEIKGAALAICTAHSLGFVMTLYFLRRRKASLFLSFKELTTPRWASFKQLFKIGLPNTIEQLVWSLGQLVVTGYVALIGITELAIHQVLLRIQGVLSMFYLGFGLAAMTFMGKNLGANDHSVAEHTGRMTHRTVLVFSLMLLTLMIVFSSPLLHLFVRKEDTIIARYGFRAIFLVFSLTQVPKAMNTVIAGSLRGAGDIKWIMWVNIFAVLLLEIGVNWVCAFVLHFGLFGIWCVQLADELVKSQVNYRRFRGGRWKLIKI